MYQDKKCLQVRNAHDTLDGLVINWTTKLVLPRGPSHEFNPKGTGRKALLRRQKELTFVDERYLCGHMLPHLIPATNQCGRHHYLHT